MLHFEKTEPIGRLFLILWSFVLFMCLAELSGAIPEALSRGAGTRASLPVHNLTTGLNYSSITAAISADETLNGHTVFVDEGVYPEHVYVSKSLTIIGANPSTTIVDSMGSFRGFLVFADRVDITGFTVQNATWAIYLNTSGNRVYGNMVRNSKIGVRLDNGENNTIFGNTIEDMLLDGEGLFLENARGNVIQGNLFVNDSFAISLILSMDNTIKENTIRDCSNASIWLQSSSNNKVYHNNFVNNAGNATADFSFNTTWDNGYPSGGNYWSSYNHPDLRNGTNQDMTGSDGIGDIPHVIDGSNEDNYPLMAPMSVFDAGSYGGLHYSVEVVSNSALAAFRFNSTKGPFLQFGVAGQNGTIGFCRVTIPERLLWVDDGWGVTVGGESVNYTASADEDNAYLYFVYQHSAKIVEIRGTHAIPELKPVTILLSALIAITLVAAILKKR